MVIKLPDDLCLKTWLRTSVKQSTHPFVHQVGFIIVKAFVGNVTNIKISEFSKLADTILHGNMKELRNQVIVHWPNINRKYKDHHFDNR